MLSNLLSNLFITDNTAWVEYPSELIEYLGWEYLG